MALEFFEKQPYEEFPISMDLVDVLETGEAIVLGNCTVVANLIEDSSGEVDPPTDSTAIVIDTPSMVVDGSNLKIRVKAGAHLDKHQISMYAETDQNNKWEKDVVMRVKEL